MHEKTNATNRQQQRNTEIMRLNVAYREVAEVGSHKFYTK